MRQELTRPEADASDCRSIPGRLEGGLGRAISSARSESSPSLTSAALANPEAECWLSDPCWGSSGSDSAYAIAAEISASSGVSELSSPT